MLTFILFIIGLLSKRANTLLCKNLQLLSPVMIPQNLLNYGAYHRAVYAVAIRAQKQAMTGKMSHRACQFSVLEERPHSGIRLNDEKKSGRSRPSLTSWGGRSRPLNHLSGDDF